MATSTGNFVCDNSSLANFKSWAQAISNAFSAFGWTQTTDTGQVNWGTIASVPSSTFVYEVWKAADALASTMPIFVKVQYGFSSTSPRFQITVGTGSDGAGNITSQVISSAPWAASGNLTNQGASTFPCYFSGSAGEFRALMWSVSTSTPNITAFFTIERSKDGSGNNTASYVTVTAAGSGASSISNQQTVTASAAANRETGIVALAGTNGSNTGAALGTVAALPVFPLLGLVGNPMLGLMVAFASDVAANSTCTVASMYGSTHTYIAFNPGGLLSNALGARNINGATMAGLMRYE